MSLLLKHEFVILVEGPAMQGRCHTAANIEFSGQKRKRNSPGETRRLIATPLGRATALSGLPPRDAVEVLASLQDARRSLVLRSGLHPIYLATPPHPSVQPAWATFEHLLAILQKDYPVCSSNLLLARRLAILFDLSPFDAGHQPCFDGSGRRLRRTAATHSSPAPAGR